MSTRFAGSYRRRAASAILVLVTVPVIVGFAALTIDVGMIYNTRVDLQNAADAAAMAATHAMTSEAMMQVRMGTRESLYEVVDEALTNTATVSEGSRTFGGKYISIEATDVTLGWINTFSATEPLRTAVSATIYNAVRVEARRTKESANGAVQLFFAQIFGHSSANVTASAVAVFDDRFSVFDAERDQSSLLWPFTKNIDEYEAQLTSGGDNYGYDSDADAVTSGADGTREVHLFPGDEAPGNYGLLNIGPTSLSYDELNAQIINGITVSDLEASFGSSELAFYDESGSPTPYDINGNTGLKSKLEDAALVKVGDIVGFFVHDMVMNSGANASYRVVGMRWGRVMHVALQDSAKTRGLWIQPITYDGPGVGTNPGARPTRGGVGRILLAR